MTTLIRRLAQYAGMGDVELRVTEHLDEDPEEEPSPVRFVGIEAGVLGFEVLEYRPWDQMVDALVFEVAAAYRCFHALDTEGSPYRDSIAIGDADAWADCVGVTACFLGMGVLAANAADRFQTNGHLSGGWVHTEWRHDLRGSLTQEMLTWLLSV
ncbi:MAG: hypothetical protein OEY14_15165, partial [Myxococcales bacterium]|nr:hypothetical protein [Myxococcales bacterium]